MTTAGPFLSEAVKQEIGTRYLAGATLEAVAEAVGLDAHIVTATLANMGITLRDETAVADAAGRPPLDPGEIARAYKAGASIREIMRDTGRGYGTIHRALADAEVTFRPRGFRPRTSKATPRGD